MPAFAETGIRDELLRTLEEEELAHPTALQEGVIPAIRRGGNVVARASAGAGKTLAYGLGLLDRLAGESKDGEEDEAAVRALILTPDPATAKRVALDLSPYGQAVGVGVGALATGWSVAHAPAVVVAAAADAMQAVRGSSIKLDKLQAFVVDGAAAIESLDAWSDVDNLLEQAPSTAQRVVLSHELTSGVQDLIDRRVKKALRYPAEPAVPDRRRSSATPTGTVSYVIASEAEKIELLAEQLTARDAEGTAPIVFCRTDERAAELAEALAQRGFLIGDPGDDDADVVIVRGDITAEELAEETEGETPQTISFDVPSDTESLINRHGSDDAPVVLVLPREVNHLREIAGRGNLDVDSLPGPARDSRADNKLRSFREEVEKAIREEDLAAQMLILQPLLDRYSATEVAAAVSALLRSRRPAEQPKPAAAPVAPAIPAVVPDQEAPSGPPPPTWSRLFVGVGSRDEIRPGDLVGALAGEADIPGSRIGKIEIRDSFSIVEVQSDLADKVIRAVNGTTIKGRSVRVDYDRGGPSNRPQGRAQGRAGGGEGGPRGGGPRGGGPRGGGPRGGGAGGPRRTNRRPPAS